MVKMTVENTREKTRENDEEPKYPYSVFFIVTNEFCERFCFYGMRSILTLYLVNILFFEKSDATVIYHTFTMMVYFFPIIGAILSDSYLGKFRTIFYVSLIYAAGSIILSISSIEPLKLPIRGFSLLGLSLIAVGTGGIKPCVSAFGGDQFILPQQARMLATFFSLFYFSINAGSLLSTFVTPILREDVHCFGNNSCYPLAFGVPGMLMVIAIVIFGLGKPLYRIKKPEGNIVLKVVKCMMNAITTKSKTQEEREHWLDHSTVKYGETFVNEVKATLRVLVLYAPLPIYWALYDQQGTAWTFQAVRMDGNIGIYTILPDQFQLVNPLMIMMFIPIFQYIVYPNFQKINLLKTPLERMAWGGFLAALAFVCSAFVSLQIEATDPVLPTEGYAQLRFYNPLPCDINLIATDPPSLKENLGIVESMGFVEILDFELSNTNKREVTLDYNAACGGGNKTATFLVKNKETSFVSFTNDGFIFSPDAITKDVDSGQPFLRTITNKPPGVDSFQIKYLNSVNGVLVVNNTNIDRIKTSSGHYHVENTAGSLVNETEDISFNLELGGVYTLMLSVDNNNKIVNHKLITVTKPNSISMLWLLPQYIIITAAEILFSITGLEFSYSQAPLTMKSVLTASFLLTDSIGNLIVVIIESAKVFDKASYDFFLYTVLMILDMLVFSFLASKYQYIDHAETSEVLMLDKDNNILQSKSENYVDNPGFRINDQS